MKPIIFALAISSVLAAQQFATTPFTQSLHVSEKTKKDYLDELFFCYDLNGDGQLDKNETLNFIEGQLNGTAGECEGQDSLDSALLSKNSSYFTTLKSWLGAKKLKLELLYRSSRDLCSYISMHNRVDNKGPTITVMTSQAGEVFGGYLSIPFDKNVQGRKADKNAFLFSLSRNEKYPIKNPSKAYQEDADYIIAFGKDDLQVKKSCKGSTYYFGEDYSTNPYVEYSTFETQTMNWLHKENSYDFTPLEIEVFSVKVL